jgi:hypothetical protein
MRPINNLKVVVVATLSESAEFGATASWNDEEWRYEYYEYLPIQKLPDKVQMKSLTDPSRRPTIILNEKLRRLGEEAVKPGDRVKPAPAPSVWTGPLLEEWPAILGEVNRRIEIGDMMQAAIDVHRGQRDIPELLLFGTRGRVMLAALKQAKVELSTIRLDTGMPNVTAALDAIARAIAIAEEPR